MLLKFNLRMKIASTIQENTQSFKGDYVVENMKIGKTPTVILI